MDDRNIVVGKSWPRPATACNLVPNWEGEFRDFQDWVSFAHKRLTVASDSAGVQLPAICVDTLGRRCHNGRDMARARDEATFPVRYFFECVEHDQPKHETLVPGVLRCAKCEFRLNKVTLNLADGNAYANNDPDNCPNCNVPMLLVSWKEDAEYAYRVCESQVERAVKAEAELTELRRRPTEDAYLLTCRALHWRTAELRAHGIEPLRIEEHFAHQPAEGDITRALPHDVVALVIAAREAWERHGESGDDLDRALEQFSARVPYENQPETQA